MSTTAITNRSIRTIKAELEFLVDSNLLDQEVLSKIFALLPSTTPTSMNQEHTTGSTLQNGLNKNLDAAIKNAWSATSHTIPPAASKPVLPQRTYKPPTPPVASPVIKAVEKPAPAPVAPEIPPPPAYDATQKMAKALYDYPAAGDTDISFKTGEVILVTSDNSDDWWYGRSMKTGQEGYFPQNRTVIMTDAEKKAFFADSEKKPHGDNMMLNVAYGGGSGSSGLNSNDEHADKGKNKFPGGETGKKIGGKLGNAAIFGAGATIGSKIVNGIF